MTTRTRRIRETNWAREALNMKARLLTLQRRHEQLQRLTAEFLDTHKAEATTPRQNTLVQALRGLVKEKP